MTPEIKEPAETKKPASKGARNLSLLALFAVVIALTTSGLSLYIYHATGDIYLDRSRPGYLPEKPDNPTKPEETYKFSADGPVNEKILDEYLREFDKSTNALDSTSDAFDGTPLTDEFLNIPE